MAFGDSVAVVMPVFNRRELVLERSLPSVLAQTEQAAEIVVVDDGSTDGLASALREFHPRVRVICQENRGVSAARNAGVAATVSDWVAFLDSDDEWLPAKLARQLAALRSPQANPDRLRVCHTHERWLRNGKPLRQRRWHRKTGGWIFQRCLKLCCMSPSSIMIHRSVLDEVGGFDESLPACEDYDLWLRVCARMPVLYLDEALLVKHGGHADQLSMKYPLMDGFRAISLQKVADDEGLPAEKRQLAMAELRQRLEWLVAGAEKHGNGSARKRYADWLARLQ